MEHRARIAHHEAAHVVLAVFYGTGVNEQGIDLNASTSVEGAYGNAAVNLFAHDASLEQQEQQKDLLRNLCIVCAGAASDAKILNRSLREALSQQPGDEKVALRLLAQSTLISRENKSDAQKKEEECILEIALEKARDILGKTDVWALVEEIAQECLRKGGHLTKAEIEAMVQNCKFDRQE
jgi:hypothetical protein